MAALVLWRTHSDDVRNSEEVKVARSVANAGLGPLGHHIRAPEAAGAPEASAAVPVTSARRP